MLHPFMLLTASMSNIYATLRDTKVGTYTTSYHNGRKAPAISRPLTTSHWFLKRGLRHSMVMVTPPTLADNSTPTLTPCN